MDSRISLWRTYGFILLTSVVVAGSALYFEWENIVNSAEAELNYANKIISGSIESSLKANEALLKILGERLVANGALDKATPKAKLLVDELLTSNPQLAGIGLANPSGQLVLTSFNIDRSKLPNLLNSPKTSETFKLALQNDRMIIGHTYFMPALQEWVIPLRFRILDETGAVVAVMTSGLKAGINSNLWSSFVLPEHIQIQIIRSDLYRLFVIAKNYRSLEMAYLEPIPQSIADEFEQSLFKASGFSLLEMQKNGQTVTLRGRAGSRRIPVIYAVNFNHNYGMFTLLAKPISIVLEDLYWPASLLLLIVILFNGILYLVFRNNIILLSDSKSKLLEQASHDPLTKLPNRRYLLDYFNHRKDKGVVSFYFLFIDLNNFKTSNDLHGHSVGDKILIEAANRINSCFADSLSIRHGGDEFIIICEKQKYKNIQLSCDEFINNLRKPIHVADLEFSIGASIGIACSPKDGVSVDELQRKSDMAMYEAKRNGLDFYIFSNDLEEEQQRKATIEKELNLAIERDEFHIVYQPQIDAGSKKVIGVEALLRWQNKILGFVPPDEFIPIAEATGEIMVIGLYVFETAMHDISTLSKKLNLSSKLRLSINVSVRQLFTKEFDDHVTRITNNPVYKDLKIAIEVTESLFINDIVKAKVILDRIQQSGMEISLDDFGTGYSSLSVLNNLPFNELKIDKSFVRNILFDDSDKSLIKSIINLGRSLNIPVLAEGVEGIEQADLLQEYGCDMFQGYYFSKPLMIDDLRTYLTNKNTS